jgi:PPOX class probable F420-dependent enzyme
VRSGLAVEDLGDFLQSKVLATLATYGSDGKVRLSPVWFEWRDGGFNVVVGASDVKSRHLRRDPRVALTVYENEPPYRGVEIRAEARLILEGAAEADRRMAVRYLGRERGDAYLASLDWQELLVRIEPGELRVWDFADEWPGSGP